jgi:endo-1,4-beta-mannosidase
MKTCNDCILEGTDACSRGNNSKICERFLTVNKIDASEMHLKPISFEIKEFFNTNLQRLWILDAEQFYDKMVWLFQDYGKRFSDSRTAIIEWLNSEVKDESSC